MTNVNDNESNPQSETTAYGLLFPGAGQQTRDNTITVWMSDYEGLWWVLCGRHHARMLMTDTVWCCDWSRQMFDKYVTRYRL